MEELTPMHFIAQLLHNDEAKKEGYIAAPRWLVTRDDLKEKFLNKATKIFEDWKEDELQAKRNRDSFKF